MGVTCGSLREGASARAQMSRRLERPPLRGGESVVDAAVHLSDLIRARTVGRPCTFDMCLWPARIARCKLNLGGPIR